MARKGHVKVTLKEPVGNEWKVPGFDPIMLDLI